jgi:demethylmenaquinone methyltransferase/2-methoxy-6-polyprenyl-1,4-benzoquinol methylase
MNLSVEGRWRRRVVRAARLRPGDSVLHVSCGTGVLTALLAERVGPFGWAEGVDTSSRMIEQATDDHHALVQAHFRVADELALPYEDAAFHAAVMAFALRGNHDVSPRIAELARVVRPGGRIVCLELTQPRQRLWRRVYGAAVNRVSPLLARLGVRSDDAIPLASTEGLHEPEEIAAAMRASGAIEIRQVSLSMGIACMVRGTVGQVDLDVVNGRSAGSEASG